MSNSIFITKKDRVWKVDFDENEIITWVWGPRETRCLTCGEYREDREVATLEDVTSYLIDDVPIETILKQNELRHNHLIRLS